MSEYIITTHDEPDVDRCKDCIYFATDELGDYCTMFDFGNVKNMENGFCAWGERKENGCQ